MNQAIQYSLVGYAVMSCLSIAGSSIFIGCATLAGLIKILKERRLPTVEQPKLLRALFLFLGAMLLSAIFSPHLSVSFDKTAAYFSRMFPLFLVLFFVRDQKVLRQFLLGIVFSITVASFAAVWQGLHGDYRASAFASHPMILAGYLLQVIGILLVLFQKKNQIFVGYHNYFAAALALSLIALFFNGTRGAWFAVAAVIGVFSFQQIQNKKKWIGGCLLVFLLLGGLFCVISGFHDRVLTLTDKSFGSNSERLLLWQSSWQMFLDHPLLGIGVGNFHEAYTTQYILPQAVERGLGHAHNNFVQMLADAGLIGLISFLYLYWFILKSAYQDYRKHSSDYSLLLILVTAGLLLQGLTEFNFGDSAVIRLYWFITGISFCTMGRGENDSKV